MGKTLVLGYGNTLRADDGAGHVVAERLAASTPPEAPAVEVLTAYQLTPELAMDLADAERVLFIDASAELAPGQVRMAAVDARDVATGPINHHLTPQRLMALTEAMFDRTPQAWTLAVGVADLSVGEGLSPHVAEAIDEMVRLGRQWLRGETEVAHA